MPVLKALTLTNIGPYDHAEFPLDRQGVTMVYGRNFDSSPDDLKSNGAGKSMPFHMLAEMITDQSPLIAGRDAVKDGFQREGAAVSLDFDDYRVSRHMPGRTIKLDMFKQINGDWRPSKVRTNEYVQTQMAKLLPLTNDEFYTLYYVDSSRPSLLQRGSHTDRLRLFSQMFNLDKYDLMLAEVKSRLKEMRQHEARLSEVLNQITVLEQAIDAEVLEEGDRLAEMRERQRKLSAKRQEANSLLSLANLWHSQAGTLASLQAFLAELEDNGSDPYEGDLFKKADLKELQSAIQDGVKAIRKRLRQVNQQQDARAERKAAKIRKAELEKVLGDYLKHDDPIASINDDIEQAETFQAELDEMEAVLRQLEKKIEKIEKAGVGAEPKKARKLIDAELDEAPTDPEALLAQVGQWVSDARARYDLADSAHRKFAKAFRDCADANCSTCHQTIDADTIANIDARLEKAVRIEKKAYDKAAQVQEAAEEWCEWAVADARLKALTAKRDEEAAGRDAFAAQGSNALNYEYPEYPRKCREAWLELKKLNATLADTSDDELDDDPDELAERLSRYEKADHCITSLLPVIGQLATARDKQVGEYDVEQLEQGLKGADKKLRALMDEIPTLAQQVSVAQNNLKQLQQLEEKRADLETELADYPLLKALEVAYGQKGLKKLAIQRSSQVIESNLNLHAPLLFSEPVRFTLEVTETKMNILVSRKYKGVQSTVDVRRLSGAESRALNLLLPMAILPLVPQARRLNLMVLDEPTANMDQPAIELMTNKFLPRLLELVPHIIVISPHQLPVDMDNVAQWRVERRDGTTTLTTGDEE